MVTPPVINLSNTPGSRAPRRSLVQRIRGFRLELSPIHYIIVGAALALVAFAPGTAQVLVLSAAPADTAALGDAESADRNFPGSAFYFLDPASLHSSSLHSASLDPASPAATAAPTDEALAAAAAGPAAQPFALPRRSAAYGRALKCLTDAIYYEAATEPDSGQRAVAQVVLNRMRHPTYPNSVCGVVYQGSERATGCQFSFSCDGSMARVPSPAFYARAARVAAAALAGAVYPPAGLATHYHTSAVSPYWAPSLHFISTIGAHRFYRWRGSAGTPTAFYTRHAGAEPNPWPAPRASAAVLAMPAPDPIMLQRQYEDVYEKARQKALAAAEASSRMGNVTGAAATYGVVGAGVGGAATARHMPEPKYAPVMAARGGEAAVAGSRLPGTGAGSVRAEYAASGSWKTPPVQ